MSDRATTQLAKYWSRTQSVMFEGAGREIVSSATVSGRAILLFADVLSQLGQIGRCGRNLLNQIERSGFGSLMVLALITGLTGMIMAFQTGTALQTFNAQGQLGQIIALTFCRELGPIWAAVIVLARVGAAMAAELGTMVVNEEVDALRCMGVDPVRYLVLPRVAALVIVMPLLAGVGDLVGIAGGSVVSVTMFGIPFNAYYENALSGLRAIDVFGGLFKATVFGAIIAVISCDKGLATTDGAEGVGRSTTGSVVLNVIFVLVADLILTWVIKVFIAPVFA